MSTPFLGEIKIFSFNFAPQGWAMCNGQFLAINQNQALFSLLGTMYGGNGQTTFALPDLRGRSQVHQGNGFNVGQAGGQEAHTVTMSEMPAHFHNGLANPNNNNAVTGANANANQTTPVGNFWANSGKAGYTTAGANAQMAPSTVSNVGGSQPHQNMSPFLVLTFCIALTGIFPSQN